ncbi:MAG TPA: ABC transporter permease [Dehalococcoidales bacterium]|nr:ABC transporter permease [Dehalococcoidales bacterium]
MNRAFIVALREVRTYLQDKADLAFSLLLPIIIFALMYFAFGGDSLFHGTAHVVNEDEGGVYSTVFLEQLEAIDVLDIEVLAAEDADTKLDNSDLLMVIYIPEDFSAKLAAGEPTQLLFKQRGNGGDEGQIVASLVRGVAEQMNQEFQVYNDVNSALAEYDIPQARISLTVENYLDAERASPVIGVNEQTVGSSPDPVNMFLPGVITMFVLFAITLSARAIVEERRKGTLERLLTTRLSAGELFAGKFLANVSRGFVQTVILLILAYIVFQLFTPLTFIECLVIALVFAAAASGLGMIIAAIARTEDSATWIAVFFTMVMVMLGGTFFEVSEGSLLYTIGRFSINTYANDAFKTIISEGGSLANLGMELGILAGVAVVGLGLSRVLFKVMPGGK